MVKLLLEEELGMEDSLSKQATSEGVAIGEVRRVRIILAGLEELIERS